MIFHLLYIKKCFQITELYFSTVTYNRDPTELVMEMGNPSDQSVSMLSPPSDLPIIDPEMCVDSRSDSSKKTSKFNLYVVPVFVTFWMSKPEFMPFSSDTESRKTSTSCPLTSVRPNTEDAELRSSVSVNKCRVCRKEFKTSSALKTHLLIHRHEGPHICSVCQRAFQNYHQL